MVNDSETKNTLEKIEQRIGNLEKLVEKENTQKKKLRITGIALLVVGLLLLGTGIYFYQAYSPANLSFFSDRLIYRQAHAAGLSCIVVGSLIFISGTIMTISEISHN